jgi:predicted nucleotidyltransferase
MRLTQKKLYNHINSFIEDIKIAGFPADKVILFGSYANGYPNEYSDIDLAVWSPAFSDDPYEDKEKIRSIILKYHPLQLHPYPSGETKEEDPFIGIIEKTGKLLIFN